jgi:hypothetical protein
VLDAEFPTLAASYRRGYAAGSDAPADYRERLRERTAGAKAHAGLPEHHARATIPRPGEQLALV